MKLLIVGMRRSGTTIVFDGLCEDRTVFGVYEPFSHAPEAGGTGGGSGARTEDYAATTRHLRRVWVESAGRRWAGSDLQFNRGAPGYPELEVHTHLDEPYLDFLEALFERGPRVVVKSVRLHQKLAMVLARIPEVQVLHVVRDPVSVLWSHARLRRWRPGWSGGRLDRWRVRRALASARGFDYWNSPRLHDLLAERSGRGESGVGGGSNAERTLRLWIRLFESVDAISHQVDEHRYRVIPLERFCAQPRLALERICEWAGAGEASEAALAWVERHVRPARGVPVGLEPAFDELIDRAGLRPQLAHVREQIALSSLL